MSAYAAIMWNNNQVQFKAIGYNKEYTMIEDVSDNV